MSDARDGPAGATIERAGERALLVRFHDFDLAAAVDRARTLRVRLLDPRSRLSTVAPGAEIVSGAGSLLLRLAGSAGSRALDLASAHVRALLAEPTAPRHEPAEVREHVVEVAFGGDAGPDLLAVAEATGLAPDAVVERLMAARLSVAFVGFSPGFPYLIGLPSELELPRRPSPRPSVPAGSVAIAGPFAGIYPSVTSGGWHLVGRTDRTLFDAEADPPALLAPGDRVRFVARAT